MSLSELCIRKPIATTLLMLAVLLAGLAGYRQLSVAALPRVDVPTIVVTARLAGASPEVMAVSVSAPLERQFSTIAGVTLMTSRSSQGSTQITLQFAFDRDIDAAAQDVQSALSVAQRRLPSEMTTPPSFRKVNPADDPVLFISLNSDTLKLSDLNEFADRTLAPKLGSLPGVAQAQIYGAQKYAVRIQIDPDSLAALELSVEEIQKSVAAAVSISPMGVLSGEKQTMILQTGDEPRDAAALRKLVVAWRNGAPLRLGEVATVIDSVENDRVASWYNGRRAILVAIQRQPDANAVEVVDAVRRLLPSFRAQLPAAAEMNVLFDRSISVRQSVADVQHHLWLSVGLVVMVIFLFLRRASATIIPSLALPFSLVGAFGGMYLLGFSLNNVSLMAITLAVGFVVDDAIVMLENIVRHVEEGMKPFEAALKGAKEITFTIWSMTLSLVAVFIPVLLMGDMMGRFLREFAVTIALAILISGFVSVTLTPMLCSRILRHRDPNEPEGPIGRGLEAGYQAMLRVYEWSLRIVMRWKRVTLALTVLSVGAAVWGFAAMPKGFLPTEDTGLLRVTTESGQDSSFAATAVRQKQVAELFSKDPDVTVVNSTVGNSMANAGFMFVGLKPKAERSTPNIMDVQRRLTRTAATVPGIEVRMTPIQNFQAPGQSPNARALYQYTLVTTEQSLLNEWTPKMEAALKTIPHMITDISTDLQVTSPMVDVLIDRDRAASLGVTTEQVRTALYSLYGPRQVATLFTPANDYPVLLEAKPERRQGLEDVTRLHVRAANGEMIPLDAVATVRRSVGPLMVNRVGQLTAATFSFNTAPGVSLSDATAAIRALEPEISLPAAISAQFMGAAEQFEKQQSGQALLILAALITIYIILGVLYESYIHPVTILSGLPAAGLGALLTLWLFDMPLDVMGIIGVIMLIGIVKKNAIMMIDFAIESRAAGERDPAKAIFDACLVRFRPIMMTTMAALAGAIPIAMGAGAGAELRQPLGVAVVGGLVISQALTLYITPVIYLYLDRLNEWLSRRMGAADDVAAAEPHSAPASAPAE